MINNVINFVRSCAMVVVTIGCVCVATLLYNMGGDIGTETNFFRPNKNPEERPSMPASPDDLERSDKMQMMLLDNYIANAFGVVPYSDVKLKEDIIAQVSGAKALEYLRQHVWPQVTEMTAKNMLRTARVESMTPETNSNYYWRVRVKFTTWHTPNDFSQEPEVTYADFLIAFAYKSGLPTHLGTSGISIEEYLEHGINGIQPNPAWVFQFGVGDIVPVNG